eukprot:3982614-Prymnesium_polylepis.1
MPPLASWMSYGVPSSCSSTLTSNDAAPHELDVRAPRPYCPSHIREVAQQRSTFRGEARADAPLEALVQMA